MTNSDTTTNKDAKDANPPSTPGVGHQRLNAFVGTWHTTGSTRATADAPSERIEATDRYEWMEGGFFLLHHIDSRVPKAFKGLEIIGYDAAGGNYSMSSFYGDGTRQVMTGNLKGADFQITGPTERFAGTFSKDGASLSGTWERSEDGRTWQPWMDITLQKRQVP